MNSKTELPLIKPVYSATHGQGTVTSILHSNPSIINWYLNNVMVLSVSNNDFGENFQPHVDICQSGIEDNPYIERQKILLTFLDGSVNRIIRNMINKGYYVYFGAIDDYYMQDKSGYHKDHFMHDGMICGYDQNNKTYSVYAYDSEMQYRIFRLPQICFERARKSTEKMGACGFITAMKPMQVKIDFDPYIIKTRLQEYLDPPLINNNLEVNSTAYGIITHKYLIKYLDIILNDNYNITLEDLKSFKMIMEHKTLMFERIKKIEAYFQMDNTVSSGYKNIVTDAEKLWNMCLYSFAKTNKSKLPTMKLILERIDNYENKLLSPLISLY